MDTFDSPSRQVLIDWICVAVEGFEALNALRQKAAKSLVNTASDETTTPLSSALSAFLKTATDECLRRLNDDIEEKQ